MAGVRTPQRLAGLWKLIGRTDLPEADERYLQQFPDADFVFDEMIPAIEEWSSQRPKWEVAGRLTELGFSMGVAQSVADLADCPQLQARGMYVDTGDTLGGTFRSLATPIQLTSCRPPDTMTPPEAGPAQRRNPLHPGRPVARRAAPARGGRGGIIIPSR